MYMLSQPQPVPHNTLVRVTAGFALFAATAGGLYEAGGVVSRRMQSPDTTTYMSRSQLDRSISLYEHTPASKAGAFIPSASIAGSDVRVGGHLVAVK